MGTSITIRCVKTLEYESREIGSPDKPGIGTYVSTAKAMFSGHSVEQSHRASDSQEVLAPRGGKVSAESRTLGR